MAGDTRMSKGSKGGSNPPYVDYHYGDCPGCKQDWGMGLMYKDRRLAVECIDCGFRGPAVEESVPIEERDALAIAGWRALPRENPIVWTPEMRIKKMMGQL